MPGFDEAHILGMAALASSDGGQDSVDAAIRSAASQMPAADLPTLKSFVPFDPGTKISEAMATDAKGRLERIVKRASRQWQAWQHRFPPRRRLRRTLKNKASGFWRWRLALRHPCKWPASSC
jgi:H+-transporting ATPase